MSSKLPMCLLGSSWVEDNTSLRPNSTPKKVALYTDSCCVLITYAPPKGILDRNGPERGGESCGCELMAQRLDILKPKLHVFGHIHEARGSYVSSYGTTHINASSYYKGQVRSPIVVEIDNGKVKVKVLE